MEDAISRVAVLGTGQMGPGIAVVTAMAGCQTTLVGRSPASLADGRARFESALAFMVENEVVSDAEAAAAAARLVTSMDLDAAAEADIAIESIVESLATKQEFFAALDDICPAEVILASNTSGLRISEIALRMTCPERAVTTHFWNPGHLMPLVEVIQGERTNEETVQRTYAFLLRCGKRPVIGRKDVPGQICNRLLQAVTRECIYMVQEGIASAEDVETALKAGAGLRFPVYGPLEHADAVGLDLALKVQTSVLPSLCSASEPGQYLKGLVAEGNLGAASGQGFHNWETRDVGELRRTRDLFLVQRMKEARR